MTTLINFRDFGGSRNVEGRYVREGCLYRSGHLASLARDASELMLAMDFDLVVDLRYFDERTKHVSPWPPAHAERLIYHPSKIGEDAPHLNIMRTAGEGVAQIDAAYREFYAALPFDANYKPLFANALERMAFRGGRTLIHCSAGKDRTGTLVALLLSVLGVDDATIVDEYMRSNGAPGMERLREYVREHPTPSGKIWDDALVDALIEVKPSYIAAALNAIRERHGSVEGYLRDGGLNASALERLRGAFLADGPDG
ncbi:tyrosine-protein phosphatase [Novosphingobium sp. 9U]|uniref:tyrosine-protein phosphatase n=1 Tax=Novosphingobium sp. 9U TaxID=2653158 RepID=UPI0012F027DD|nr:tyrosine-protein phosphatase [Novosphingobium sp. 9U]VWX50093.1 Tyrosine-protein phosphatase [Novosphingobium sp. 9U]